MLSSGQTHVIFHCVLSPANTSERVHSRWSHVYKLDLIALCIHLRCACASHQRLRLAVRGRWKHPLKALYQIWLQGWSAGKSTDGMFPRSPILVFLHVWNSLQGEKGNVKHWLMTLANKSTKTLTFAQETRIFTKAHQSRYPEGLNATAPLANDNPGCNPILTQFLFS